MTVRLDGILAIRMVTQDPERLVRFYGEALGAESDAPVPIPSAEAELTGAGERWTLRLGAQRIELDAFAKAGAPYPPDVAADDPRFQHIAIVAAGIEAAFDRAIRCGARPISRDGPVKLPAASGGATAVKLRDPEGHPFELIALAPGPWDRVAANACGLRGIDHSAIAVRDLDASLAFYAAHGLTERGASFNHGPEQGALDGLASPEVDVAPLYPQATTPHLELLHYRTGPRALAEVGDRDVAATRIVWRATGADRPSRLRDPDGHRHLLQPTPAALPGA